MVRAPMVEGYVDSRTLRACCNLASSRSSFVIASRISVTFCSCLPICSRTTSTGVFLIQGLRPVDVPIDV